MKTFKLPYTTEDEEFFSVLQSYREVQSSVYRQVYKLLESKITEKEIRDVLKTRNLGVFTDSWFQQSAIYFAKGQYKADTELGVTGRIFGGKANFTRRLKGLISNEEYQKKRLEPLYIIGEASARGNRKVELRKDSILVKFSSKLHFELKLPNLRKKRLKEYLQLVISAQEKKLPVTFNITETYIHISFDESKLIQEKPKKIIKGRHIGIDVNPNYIGISVFNEHRHLLETKLYNLKELTGKNINHGKLKHETIEIGCDIGRLAKHYRVEYVFVEDLSFKQGDKGKGKWFNRLTQNQFLFNELFYTIRKYANVVEVNAAYSSTIGNVVNNTQPDPIAASMEVARRGIESRVVKSSGKFYPPLVSKEVFQNLWKKDEIPNFETWIEVHQWIKKTGVKYRVDIPDISMFRIFKSGKSKVLVLKSV